MKCYVIDDRPDFFAVVARKLGEDFRILTVGKQEWTPADIAGFDVVICSLPNSASLGYEEEVEQLRRVVAQAGGVPIIGCIGEPDRKAMREIVASGAYDCFVESSPLEELRIVLRRAAHYHELRRELERLRSTKASESDCLVNSDPEMVALHSFAMRIAPSDANVLLTGETGTGKEVLARAIHRASGREQSPFVPVACSSLPETLIEAELFGHERGAFTGATVVRQGRFEAAGHGTIFLDEIGELTPALQVKLLRVLQECQFERLGSNRPRPMEARVICATNRDLKAMVRAGQFRADLYYRLNTVEIQLPPLRKRREDIVALAYLFLKRYAEKQKRSVSRIGPVALSALCKYDWPGNVRELEHVIERAVVICDGPEIMVDHLPQDIRGGAAAGDGSLPVRNSVSLDTQVKTFKRQLIEKSLEQAGHNKVRAARNLCISRSSLHRLIEELDISPRSMA